MNKRKKIIAVILLIAFLIFTIFSVVLHSNRKPVAYSTALYSDVHQLLKITPPLGFNLMEQRSISRKLNKAPTGMNPISRWFSELRHPSVAHDVDTYIYINGTNTITATVFHDDNAMLDVKIRPSSSPSKEADDLKATLLSRFPDLPCD